MAGMIVVGVDSSTPSRAALEWGVRRAASTGSDVTLVHVVDDESAANGARPVNGGNVGARRFLETEVEHAGSLEPTVVVHGELRAGSPMRELVAASAGAELVVVGTHKTGFVHGKVFGSRTLQLAAASRVPVAVIPESSTHGRSGIVAGIDDSPASAAAVRFATEESERVRHPLYLVRAWGWHETLGDVDTALHDENRRAETTAKDMLRSTLALLEPDVDAHPRAVRRPAAEALVAAAASASVLVIGSSRRDGEERLVLGSVAHDVLVNITGPTIIVHAGDPVQADPVQADPVQADAVQADPVQADPVQADAVRADQDRSDSNGSGPSRGGPNGSDPSRAGQSRAGQSRAGQGRADPTRADQTRKDPK